MRILSFILVCLFASQTWATTLTIPGGGSGNANMGTNTIWAAKGDILGATGNDAASILTVGTDGQVLTANSAASTGMNWTTLGGGGNALTANPLSQFASTTSAQFAGVIFDETGTGLVVLATSPTLVTPTLGVATVTSVNGHAFPAGSDVMLSLGSTATVTGKTLAAANNVIEADTVLSYTNMIGDFTCVDLACSLTGGVDGTDIDLVSQAGGSLMYRDGGAAAWVHLGLGSVGQVLTVNPGGTAPEWSNATATGDNVLIDSANVTNPDFVSTGDIDFVNTANTITANVQVNSVALGTDTTGNYAGSSSEGGAATTATALAANGADCSAGSAPLGVDASGAVTSCFDVTTQVEGDLKAPLADPVFTGSLQVPNGAAPTVDAAGEVAQDTTADQLLYGATPRVLTYVETECALITDLAAAADNRDVWMAPHAVTITSVGCSCEGTCTSTATFTLEDRGGNAMTITGTNPTCSTSGNSTYAAVTAGNGLVAGEKLNFDVGTVTPETDEYLLCWTYTVDRQ